MMRTEEKRTNEQADYPLFALPTKPEGVINARNRASRQTYPNDRVALGFLLCKVSGDIISAYAYKIYVTLSCHRYSAKRFLSHESKLRNGKFPNTHYFACAKQSSYIWYIFLQQ